jgi:hypothetical protein
MPQLRSLRLVQMQLSARKAPDNSWATEEAPTTETPHQAMMREYEARRCHICQCKNPSFGFGPPLKAAGPTLWSCLAHRDGVDRIARGVGVARAEPQPRLL